MLVELDNNKYEVIVNKKIRNKNIYIRVKEDLNIYVTANTFTSNKEIEKLINENIDSIYKMIRKQLNRKVKNKEFYFLGKHYDIVYVNIKDVIIGEDKILINKEYDLDKWLKMEANKLFLEQFNGIYKEFPLAIPYPKLRIRKMTSRWGVCNTRNKIITLNLKLINMDTKYLNYVIIHELCHLIYPNHSKEYWNLVGSLVPNYKIIRKEMKE